MFNPADENWMQRALSLANQAERAGEVPVGAVLVLNDGVIGEAFNSPISKQNPCAHAEILALQQGAEKIGNYRILNATLYVTLEPCMMCAGAIVHSRIKKLIFGASDPKAGAVVSKAALLTEGFLNHRVEFAGGLLAKPCGDILTSFFQKRR